MDCAEEVSLLRRRLSRRPGILDLSFHVLEARMVVQFDPARTGDRQIAEAVAETGMRARPWSRRKPHRLDRRILTTAASGALVLGGMLLEGHGGEQLCYLAGAAIGFAPAVPKAMAAAGALRPDMHVLMAVSITGAFVLGEWSEAAVLAFLFALAGLVENWSIGKARSAIAALMRLTPATAAVLDGEGERRVPVEEVRVGETVRVRPGERIPCDGRVSSGRSTVDQAIITGESAPVEKREGAQVYAGTMNGEGVLEVEVTRGASDTTLARIIRMVQESERRRAPSEQFVERFARYYTPAMLALALLVTAAPPLLLGGAWSYWFYQGMVVLLISCPCALVISDRKSVV